MFEVCMKIHERKHDGSKMRPSGSGDAVDHWAYRWAFPYLGKSEIVIAGSEDDQGIEIWLGKKFQIDFPEVFKDLMNFVKANDMTYDIERQRCSECTGNECCVSTMPDGHIWAKTVRWSERDKRLADGAMNAS